MIEDIEEHIDNNVSLVSKFMEIDKNNKCINREIETLLSNLKYKKINAVKIRESNLKLMPKKLPKNIFFT